jgi:hypothetical protein
LQFTESLSLGVMSKGTGQVLSPSIPLDRYSFQRCFRLASGYFKNPEATAKEFKGGVPRIQVGRHP